MRSYGPANRVVETPMCREKRQYEIQKHGQHSSITCKIFGISVTRSFSASKRRCTACRLLCALLENKHMNSCWLDLPMRTQDTSFSWWDNGFGETTYSPLS